jgi:hypothetical protein
MSGKLDLGTEISLSSTLTGATRRNVLKGIGGAAVGSLGLSRLVEKATGKEPEGKVLTHTTDVHGNPDRVRVVPEERYRRLKVYEQLPAQRLIDKHDALTAITTTQRSSDPSDIGLKFVLDPEIQRGRGALPSTYSGVPVSFAEREIDRTPQDTEGGQACSASDTTPGTTTVVAYDDGTGDKVVITAEHVTDSAYEILVEGSNAGSLKVSDASQDVVSYTLYEPNFATVGDVEQIQNITGAWTFSGLADKVGQSDDGDSIGDGDTVSVDFYGQKSGQLSDECNNTQRNAKVDYQARMKGGKTKDGDSGGPWVDSNGKLLAVHSGLESSYFNSWSYGNVGQPTFDTLGVSLSN